MKERKLNNKGFSLVELIIVIAIMVILVVVIAPQYLKFVNNSRVSSDVQTAQTLATAIDVAVAEDAKPVKADGTIDFTKVSGADAMPASKFSGYSFTVTADNTTGVSKIIISNGTKKYTCYPNPDLNDSTEPGINRLNNETNPGLKQP